MQGILCLDINLHIKLDDGVNIWRRIQLWDRLICFDDSNLTPNTKNWLKFIAELDFSL